MFFRGSLFLLPDLFLHSITKTLMRHRTLNYYTCFKWRYLICSPFLSKSSLWSGFLSSLISYCWNSNGDVGKITTLYFSSRADLFLIAFFPWVVWLYLFQNTLILSITLTAPGLRKTPVILLWTEAILIMSDFTSH